MTVKAFDQDRNLLLASDLVSPCGKYFCPKCDEVVTYVKQATHTGRDGDRFAHYIRTSHFRHSPNSDCSLAREERERESIHHLAMKAAWKNAFPNAEEEVLLPSGRRADLVINAPSTGRASVECQYSSINLDTVAGRIIDHNSDGLPVAWSFAPHHLTTGKLDLFSGPMEAVMSSAFQTLNVSPFGDAKLSHVFCDVRMPNSPAVVNEPIHLANASLRVEGNKRRVIICDSDEDRVKSEAKSHRLKYWALVSRHAEFQETLITTRNAIGDETPEQREEWRKLFLSRCAERAEQEGFSIPVNIKPKDYRVICHRADEAALRNRQILAAHDERIESDRQAKSAEQARLARQMAYENRKAEIQRSLDEDRKQRLLFGPLFVRDSMQAEVKEQNRIERYQESVNTPVGTAAALNARKQTRLAMEFCEFWINRKPAQGEMDNIRGTVKFYARALSIDLSDCSTLQDAMSKLMRKVRMMIFV